MRHASMVSRRSAVRSVAAVLCGLLFVSGRVGLGAPVGPGFDLFETPPPSPPFSSSADFSTTPIPAGFFGSGSDPFTGTITLVGQPIGPGTTDTIVQRMGGLPSGGSGTIPIEIVALNLVSANPITVTYSPGSPQTWNVHITLTPPQTSGSMNVQQHNDPGGGTFTSSLPVNVQFTFTNISLPTNQTVRNDTLSIASSPWSHTPAPLDAHDGTLQSGNFYAGVVPLLSQPSFVVATGNLLRLALLPALAIPEAPAWLMLSVVAAGTLVLNVARRKLQVAE